jgi:hypothetical protein
MCGVQGGICSVNTFCFDPIACCFLYKAKHLSAPLAKNTRHLGRQTSHFPVQTKLESFFQPSLLRSKARLSALRAGCPLPWVYFFLILLVIISVRGWVDPRAIVRPEGLGKFEKNPLHRDTMPRTSRLQHSASATTLPRAPAQCSGFLK